MAAWSRPNAADVTASRARRWLLALVLALLIKTGQMVGLWPTLAMVVERSFRGHYSPEEHRGVGHGEQRRTVHQHDVIHLAQGREQIRHAFRAEQLARVRRAHPAGQGVERLVDLRDVRRWRHAQVAPGDLAVPDEQSDPVCYVYILIRGELAAVEHLAEAELCRRGEAADRVAAAEAGEEVVAEAATSETQLEGAEDAFAEAARMLARARISYVSAAGGRERRAAVGSAA